MEGGTARDLIGDIHAQQRRRVLRRAALLVTLAVVLLLIGLAFKLFADRTAQHQVLEGARTRLALGAEPDMVAAAQALEAGLVDYPGNERLLASLALVRAHQLAELGGDDAAARAAVAAVESFDGAHDAVIGAGILALVDGDHAAARDAVERARDLDEGASVAPAHESWLSGMIALAVPDPAARENAMPELEQVLAADGSLIAYRRVLIGLRMQAGDFEAALAELGRTREQSFTHKGLAADEALYNALLRQRLGGVASVAEQLLADGEGLSPRDRAHALLARGVVHVQSGELDAGMRNLEQAWPQLGSFDVLSRNLALELAMESRASERALEWARQAGLASTELEIYEAWGRLNEGDVMGSLERLSQLPQDHPRVAYLQGLALVEQGRWPEAGPWLARADELAPGRVEIEVASARVELRTGDAAGARRKLEGLAEEEPYAPRAWTGLGEAHLQIPDAIDRDAAQRAFERALEREHRPAEAMLRLAELTDAKRETDPSGAQQALELLERAAQTNDQLPRYRERLAAYLAELGYPQRALAMLRELADRPGVSHETLLRLARLSVEDASRREAEPPPELDAWLARAQELGASADECSRERARASVLVGPREQLEAAQAQLVALLDANHADVDARVLYARAQQRLFEREKAVSAIRRGLQAAPVEAHGPLYLEWARIESRSGGRRKASSQARVGWLRTQAGKHTPADLLEAADLATRLFLRDRKPKPAAQIGRALTDAVPYHAEAWVIRGRTELADKKTKEAMASAEKAVALDAESASARELLGDTALRFGFKDKARSAYERAVELAAGTRDEAGFKEKLSRL